MKPQDILFIVILGILLYKKDPRLFAAAGIASLVLSIPLFSLWVFFTAERLTWYAGAFFLFAIIINIFKLRSCHSRAPLRRS